MLSVPHTVSEEDSQSCLADNQEILFVESTESVGLLFSRDVVPSMRLGRSHTLTGYPNPRPLMTLGTSILYQTIEKKYLFLLSSHFYTLA